jgi:hypothetical protein
MIEFHAHLVTYAYGYLANLEAIFYGASQKQSAMPTQEQTERFNDGIPKILSECEHVGLKYSVMHARRLCEKIESGTLISFEEMKCDVTELRKRMHDELKSKTYLLIPEIEADFYKADQPFGEVVENSFPSAAYDIAEASKCIALDRPTACVFHLMRAIEFGLRELARSIKGQDLYSSNWNKSLNDFDSALNELRFAIQANTKAKPEGWEKQERFLSEASALLRNVKNTWRNKVMHIEKKYTSGEAISIFETSKKFMVFLAEGGLREPE